MQGLNPLGMLGGLSQAMKGFEKLQEGLGGFMQKLTQFPPNPLGAMMDFCKALKGAEQASEGVENATGMKMNPMDLLKNMLGIGGSEGSEGGEGGGGGGGGEGCGKKHGNSLSDVLDQMLPMMGMLTTMSRS